MTGLPMAEQPRHRRPGPRVLAALIVGQLGMHSAMAGLRMAGAAAGLREGYSAWTVGLLLALFAAAPVLLAMHAGRLADRLGYHRPVRWPRPWPGGHGACWPWLRPSCRAGGFGLLCLAAMA
jgi:hypothetical protein